MSIFRQNYKKGLSLITVLLFMLVATLAATGVFKWLSAQNTSSASRLMQSEVYRASQAGLETARSWMSYNASDAGALIKQYIDGNRKPILLDSVLYPLTSDKSQKFSVLLVGVDTKSYPYKLKLISTGTARSGSKYSQVAIIAVEGLYQVDIPEIKKSIDFSYAFWGANLKFGGTNQITSLVLNGDWNNNPPTISGDFIVTGSITLSGNNAVISGNTCTGKNLSVKNATGPFKDVYVHQNFIDGQGTFENLYVNGNLKQENNKITVNKNMTLNGTLITNLGGQEFEIMGNLVLGPSGVLNFDSENRPFTVHNNVWIPNSNGITGAGTNYKHYFGMDPGATLQVAGVTYVNDAGIYKNYKASSNTTFKSIASNTSPVGDPPTGAEEAKDYCDAIWLKEPGCGGLEFIVEDKLVTSYNTFKDKAVSTSTCPSLKTKFENGNQMVTTLNDCYRYLDENQPDALYNGFLVVKMTSGNLGEFTEILDGKFVFIIEDDMKNQRLPAMKSDSYVMLYLTQGSSEMIQRSSVCNSTSFYNYFIYSFKTVAQLNGFDSTCPIKGTIYLPLKNPDNGSLICDYGTTLLQNNTQLDFNPDLLNELSTANILCPNDGSVCGSPTPSSSSSSVSSNGLDAYFVAVSPRLKTTLETQYVNKELDPDTLTSSSYNLLNPSILVVPRTIYLNTNAKGTLKDYYTILNLNGAKENPNSGSVSCTPSGLNTSGALAGSYGNLYTCTYSPGNAAYNSCPFYVVVDGKMKETATAQLSLDNTFGIIKSNDLTFSGGDTRSIYLHVDPGESPKEIKFGVSIGGNYSPSWTITPSTTGTDITAVSSENNVHYFTIKPLASQKTIKLFEVSTLANAFGLIAFQLVTPFEDVLFGNKIVTLSINGKATVNRGSLKDYLSTISSGDPDYATLTEQSDYPVCPDSSNAWVYAKPDCNELNPNKSWECAIYGNTIELGWYFVDGCTVFEPQNNRIENSKDSTYTLYADLKRTPYTVYVKTVGGNANIHISDSSGLDKEQYVYGITGVPKSVQLFHGINYDIKASAVNAVDHLNYWKCKTASGADCALPSVVGSTYRYTPSTNNDTLIIYFNQKNTCFTESFQGLQENCSPSEMERCIDDCASGSSCSVNGGVYPNTADWVMIDANGNQKDIEVEDGSDAYAWNGKNGNQVFILKPTVAGYEGTYIAQIRTYIKSSIMSNQAMNTGLVFRSNADGTSYYSLSILSGKKDNTDLLRVCYATQASIANESQCISKGDALSTWSSSNLDQVETYTVKATLLGDSLYVTVLDGKGEIYIPETVFNLKDPKFNATGVSASQNEYVGFKIYGDHFRLYSVTWESKTYLCFEESGFYCSFKANYAAGRLPAKTDVTPWAFVSNFCDKKTECCTYNYIPTAPMQFEQGIYSDSTVMVWASCERDGYNNVFDTISCGAFTVGDRIPCVEDIMIATSSEYCSGYGNCEVSLDKISNLRDAEIYLGLILNSGSDTISVSLVDENGVESQTGGYMIEDNNYHFPVRDFIDVDQFDPERISKVLFKSAKGLPYEVKNIFTTCPNSLKLGSCVITYNGSKLIITGNASNAQNCSISGSYGFSETFSCEGSWTFTKDIDLSSYAGQTLTWDITAKNFQDPSITETCSGSVDIKAPSGSCSWSPSTLTATTAGTAQFTAKFSDCPASGCTYQIKDHNNIVVATGPGTVGTANFTTPKAVGSYTYSAHVNGKKLCEASLNVVAGSPATASCGGVASDGKFTASVTDTNKVGWTWKVVVTDNLGNPLDSSAVSGTTTGAGNISYSWYNPSVDGTYQYTLFLNGIEECASTLTIVGVGSITNCTLTPTTINSGEHVTFSATTEKIADGTSCVIKRPDGTEDPSVSTTINNNSCSAAFYPSQAGVYSVDIGDYNEDCGTVTINGGTSCACESYCSSGCDNIITSSGTYNDNTSRCLFFTSASKLNFGGSSTKVNGISVSNTINCFSESACITNLSSIPKVDGGYYIDLPNNNYLDATITGTDPCSGTITPSSSSVVASSSSGGVSTIDLSITNTENNSGGPLNNGLYYKVINVGSCVTIRFNCPWVPEEIGCSIKVNNSLAVSGGHNSQNNVLTPKPVVGDVLYVTGTVSNIWCANWQ